MAEVTAAMVKDLRETTGVGMMECKKALAEAGGDKDKAVILLRERGLAIANKKASRTAKEGLIASYIHLGGKVGVLVEVNCETDFVARNDTFKEFVKDITLHIAAANPRYLGRDEVPQAVIAEERGIFAKQAEGKPAHVIDKIVDGKMEKFYSQNCLLEQPFVKDTDTTIQDLLVAKIAEIGENLIIRRFTRYQVGEQI
ncbi:MAG: translation elongation factor Ts [Kiritimatiellae bacterium]|nr:translation elongation factor Ts [Kiritimatiellia bacterium]